MKFNSGNGSSLVPTVVGYQFPDHPTLEYDSNWLLIKIDAVHPGGGWSTADPFLLTYEVEELANWLEAIASGDEVSDVEVYFELESRPPWAQSDTVYENDLWLEFALDELNLVNAAQQLREYLRLHPQRAAR